MPSHKRSPGLVASFDYAVSGILHAVRTQPNMRVHALTALLVLVVAYSFGVSRVEAGLLVLAIGAVMAAEMVNTAVEATVDLATEEYHPLAATAKNVAAGAVLVSAAAAAVVGYLVFFHRLAGLVERPFVREVAGGEAVVLVALGAVVVLGVLAKSGHAPFRIQGGFPSAHTAFAFSLSTLIFLLGSSGTVTLLGLGIALLVAEARVEAKVHTVFEVVAGALIGVLVTVLAFQILAA